MIEEKLETPEKAVKPERAATIETVKKAVSRKTLGQLATHMITERGIIVNRIERMISMKIAVTEEAMEEKMLPDRTRETRAEMILEVMPEMTAMGGQEYVLLTLRKKVAFSSIHSRGEKSVIFKGGREIPHRLSTQTRS